MRNTKIRIFSFILAAAMLTGCGASAESDSKAESSRLESSQVESSESRTETETESTTTDSSETDSSALDDSSEDDSSDSSGGESSEATTTTKTSEKNKTETEKAVTTTKQTTTTSAVTTKPYVAPVTTKPTVTTKPAVQTTKTTTKATTKATSKQTADPTANMSPYYKALYRIGSGKGTTSDYETVRTEIINYGKKLYPTYKLNSNLHLYRLPNGKLTDDYKAGVSFNDVTCRDTLCLPSTSKDDIAYFDRMYKNLVVQNLSMYRNYNPNDWNVMWYVQFSKQQIGTCVIVLVDAE